MDVFAQWILKMLQVLENGPIGGEQIFFKKVVDS